MGGMFIGMQMYMGASLSGRGNGMGMPGGGGAIPSEH